MFISVSRELLAVDLRTYGEDALAEQILSATDQTMTDIGNRAGQFLPPSGLIAAGLVRATIAVLEGAPREPRWKRRRLKGIYPGV